MNVLMVYYTRSGITRQVAEHIANALDSARAVPFEQLTADLIQWADMVIVGSPTHNQGMPLAVRPLLAAMPRGCLIGKTVAAYDTSFKLWRPLMRMTAAHQILPQLKRLGGKRIARPASFLVGLDATRHAEGQPARQGGYHVPFQAGYNSALQTGYNPATEGDGGAALVLLDGELDRAAAWARSLVARVTHWVDEFDLRAAA